MTNDNDIVPIHYKIDVLYDQKKKNAKVLGAYTVNIIKYKEDLKITSLRR